MRPLAQPEDSRIGSEGNAISHTTCTYYLKATALHTAPANPSPIPTRNTMCVLPMAVTVPRRRCEPGPEIRLATIHSMARLAASPNSRIGRDRRLATGQCPARHERLSARAGWPCKHITGTPARQGGSSRFARDIQRHSPCSEPSPHFLLRTGCFPRRFMAPFSSLQRHSY